MVQEEKLDLLTAVQNIVDEAHEAGCSEEIYIKADKYIKYLSERLDLTEQQSVLISLFINFFDDSGISINEIGRFLKCSPVSLIRYMKDIDVLVEREFIRLSNFKADRRKGYWVPNEVIDAFKNDEKFEPQDYKCESCYEMFGLFEEVFSQRSNNNMSYEMCSNKINRILDCNKQLLFVQRLRDYDLPQKFELQLVLFSHLFVNNSDDDVRFHDLSFLYDDSRDRNMWRRSLLDGSNPLILCKLIEYNPDEGMVDSGSYCITENTKQYLFSELNLTTIKKQNSGEGMVKVESIVAKNLFYGEKEASQVKELGNLLDDVRYNEICKRMKDSGFRCGFSCLFYGAPGTGKTETVLQLAKQTGRDIMQVNLSQIKSKWVGESERNVKRLFDTYRSKVNNSGKTPILLFNEADGIINKRIENTRHSVDKMENTMQNIILQEMENFEGILIATTNLAQNMDAAFERRFLYKIKFEKPTKEARMSMWQEMIPSLDSDTAQMLASKYEFSGGQIENIARKCAIGNILYGDNRDMAKELLSYCEGEKLETKEMRKVGF